MTELCARDYDVAGRWQVNTPYRSVYCRVNSDGYLAGNGCRIVSSDLEDDVFLLGTDSDPGGVNSFLRNVTVEGMNFRHSDFVEAPGPGNEAFAVKVFVAKYVLNCRVKRVSAWEPLIGFWVHACVRSIMEDCKVFRSVEQEGTGDFCYAYWLRGTPAVLTGGNPSLSLKDCAAEFTADLTVNKIGFLADGSPADLFFSHPEVSAATNGFVGVFDPAGNYSALNLRIDNPVFDQCTGSAIDIQGGNAACAISISDGYLQSKSSASAVVRLRSAAGCVSLGGGLQIACGEAGNTIGVHIDGQPNVTIDPTVKIIDCPRPIIGQGDGDENAAPGCKIECHINNPHVGNGAQAAVTVAGIKNWRINPSVSGFSEGFAQGVHLFGTDNAGVVVDPTLFNRGAINSGAAHLVLVNSAVYLTAPGYCRLRRCCQTTLQSVAGSRAG